MYCLDKFRLCNVRDEFIFIILTEFSNFQAFDTPRNFDRKSCCEKTAKWSDMPLLTTFESEEKWNLLVHRTSIVCPCICIEIRGMFRV